MAPRTKTAAETDGEKVAAAEGTAAPVQIQRIQVERIFVPIVGTAPLIVHRFDEKARRMMLEKQTARKSLREVRDPQAEYEACLYKISRNGQEKYGFPASAFRKATIGAARFYDKSVSMTGLRQMFMVKGVLTKADPLALVEIEGKPEPREDTVRLPNGNAEVRFRAMFAEWSAMLEIEYVASSIFQDSLLSLVDAGGQFVGVGDWRPEKTGQFGTYEISGDIQKEKVD
jgi:hypothetical protein